MGIFSRFENRVEDTVEGAASSISRAPISPVSIAKKAEKKMRRETMVGAGKQYAPTLYTVLVNPDDDSRLFGYYPTLAGETETYLSAKAAQDGLLMDGDPLVRFIVDDRLRHGKFDVIAELVAAPIIKKLRREEMERYGLIEPQGGKGNGADYGYGAGQQQSFNQYDQGYNSASYGNNASGYPQSSQGSVGQGYNSFGNQQPQEEHKPPLPYVPEDQIDRSIDYGEYTFNSEDFDRGSNVSPYGTPQNQEPMPEQQPVQQQQPAHHQQPAQEQAPSDRYNAQFGNHSSYNGGFDQAPVGQPLQQPATIAFGAGSSAASGASANNNLVRACLTEKSTGHVHNLTSSDITLGRDSRNSIKVSDASASRKHAELTVNQQGLWVVTDLKSTNGTLVNGVSIASKPLYPGDVLTIGTTEFVFSISQ